MVIVVAGLLILICAAAIFLYVRQSTRKNLREASLPPHVVKKYPDGWMDIHFDDLKMTVRTPGRPTSVAQDLTNTMMRSNAYDDFIGYPCTGDECVVNVSALYLSRAATKLFVNPAALKRFEESIPEESREHLDLPGLPPDAQCDTFVRHAPGWPPNNAVLVYFLRRKDLLVEILVSTDKTKELAISRMKKALAGFKLDPPSEE
jgi:hypothetical protein